MGKEMTSPLRQQSSFSPSSRGDLDSVSRAFYRVATTYGQLMPLYVVPCARLQGAIIVIGHITTRVVSLG